MRGKGHGLWAVTKVAIPAVIVVVLTMASSGRAFAWTHLLNNYNNNPNDFTCGYNSSVPCLYWPEPNHVSSNQYGLINSSLSSLGPAHYDMSTAVANSFGYWNSVTGAFNPFVYKCATPTGCINTMNFGSATLTDPFTYAVTDVGDYGPVQFVSGQYYAIMNWTGTTFNNTVTFNSTLTYSDPGVLPVVADGRKVATHEVGHAECLGHTARTDAVMKQGKVLFYQPNTDDINAMRSIYTGTIPS